VPGQPTLRRYPYPETACAARLLRLLLAQDGSTTRLCDALLGRVEVEVHSQEVLAAAPDGAAPHLGGGAVLERVTSLHRDGLVAMDNLALVRLDGLPGALRAGLEAGRLPLGRLLDGALLRRRPLEDPLLLAALLARLEEAGGGPADPRASRAYLIEGQGGLSILVAETYRAAVADAFCGRS